MRSSAAGPLRHALVVVAGYSALFTWLFSQPIVRGTYMAEGDLYDWFLPIFLSPISTQAIETVRYAQFPDGRRRFNRQRRLSGPQ